MCVCACYAWKIKNAPSKLDFAVRLTSSMFRSQAVSESFGAYIWATQVHSGGQGEMSAQLYRSVFVNKNMLFTSISVALQSKLLVESCNLF